jgi:hypothetical protein
MGNGVAPVEKRAVAPAPDDGGKRESDRADQDGEGLNRGDGSTHTGRARVGFVSQGE